MEDGTPNSMNLDLNLGPVDHPNGEVVPEPGPLPTQNINLEEIFVRERRQFGPESFPIENINLEEFLDGRVREAVRQRRQRRQRWRSMWREFPVPPETRNIALELIGGSRLQTGEASIAAEERPAEVTKTCDTNNSCLNDEVSGKKEENEKGNSDEGSFFDCNICLDLAKEPVVTCCGHLFCWPCLYRWLHVHSDAKECPVCKGEVTMKNVTPIYGRGGSARETEEDSALKVPHRPQARRVESWRQTIQRAAAFTIPMEEMIRRLGSRFDLTQMQPQSLDGSHESPERNNSLLNRILTSRGRREQNPVLPSDDVVNLAGPTDSDILESLENPENRRLSSLLLRRSNLHRAASVANLNTAERLLETYFRSTDRSQEQALPVDDRDSVSSIAAVIHSESQTVDTAVEIDSTVSLSTSSSRRRNDASRISDVDSGDSRPLRRRRLH